MIQGIFRDVKKFWAKYEAALLLVSCTAALLVWAYSNFATASEVKDAKEELRAYVDVRHAEVKDDLSDIKQNQAAQRLVLDKILMRVSR